jgi:hypothetical protein
MYTVCLLRACVCTQNRTKKRYHRTLEPKNSNTWYQIESDLLHQVQGSAASVCTCPSNHNVTEMRPGDNSLERSEHKPCAASAMARGHALHTAEITRSSATSLCAPPFSGSAAMVCSQTRTMYRATSSAGHFSAHLHQKSNCSVLNNTSRAFETAYLSSQAQAHMHTHILKW